MLAVAIPVVAQGDEVPSATSGCKLEKHVYTCDQKAFAAEMTAAKNVSIETHSVDKLAASQLQKLVVDKLGKTLVMDGAPADLVFLLIPVGSEGMTISAGQTVLGTLRVYSAAASGAKGNLVWAETYSGDEDLPWPAVVNSLIGMFKGRFKIK